ncbi:MAG: GPW/gp25 family protein [Chitinophagales bacterium]
MAEFYDIPFSFSKLISKQHLDKVELRVSIENHIKGLLLTGYHSYRFDIEYGCNLKDYDFELIANVNTWRHIVERNLQQSVTKYETRVKNVRVRVKIEEVSYNKEHDNKNVSIRKKLTINVECVIRSTNQLIQLPEMSIFISPLSFI